MPEVSASDVLDTFSNTSQASGTPSSISVADGNKLAQSNPIQYTPPQPSLPQRVGEDIEKPFIQAQHTIGAGMYWLGSNIKDGTPFGGLGDRITRAGLVMQERAQDTLSKKFSNFTPGFMDQVVGAAPALATFMGMTAASIPAGVTTAAIAATAGLGIAAEDFKKFKDQGHTTPESDAFAAAVGVPTAGVTALGFNVVGKMVNPWLSKVLGDTVGKIATGMAMGAAGGAAQSATSGSLELATGATPYHGMDSLKDLIANTINTTALYGVLGGAAAYPYVFKQHNAIIDGFQKMGMDSKTAKQTADDVLGQTSHVIMDKIEQNIQMTPDEKSRIQVAPTNQDEVRPNVLARQGIPSEADYPSIDTIPKTHEEVTEMSKANEYVKLEPLNLSIKTKVDPMTGETVLDPAATTEDVRYKYTGGRNDQLRRGNALATDLAAKAGEEDDANFWGRNYTKEQLQNIIADPRKYGLEVTQKSFEKFNPGEKFVLDQEEFEKDLEAFQKHLPDIQKAISPSDGALEARNMHERFIKENGDVALSLGTIGEVRSNYFTNRLWKPEAPNKIPKIEGKAGVKTFSFHRLQRVYEDPIEGIFNGKRLATTKLSALTAVLNQDTTLINYGRQLVDETSKMQTPLLKWFAKGSTPKDWKEYDGMTKENAYQDKDGNLQIARQVAASPKEIYHGMRPLVEPDWWRAKVPYVAGIQDIQAYIKTGWLGMSAYHDITFATQTLASTGGVKTLADLPKAIIEGTMNTPAWRERESAEVKAGLMTSAVSEVMDIRNELEEKGENWDRFLKTPVIKQINQLSEAHTKFLFGPEQRWLKVETSAKNYANWVGQHPKATEEELELAHREITRATNDTFGGRNFEALGYTKTALSMLKTFLLAPDWVTSMLGFAKSVVMLPPAEETLAGIQRSPADQAMNRANLYKTLIGGYALGNALNYLLAGHSMAENKKGHQLDVEIAPGVYFSPIRGMVGEMAKVYMQMDEEGALAGVQRYAVNKASPFLGTGLMAATGESPVGGSIWKGDNKLQKQINGTWALMSHNSPVPFNISGTFNYATKGTDQTALGYGGVATGTARFAPSGSKAEDLNQRVIQAYRNGNTEFVEHQISEGNLSEEKAADLKADSQLSDAELHVRHMRIDKAIQFYQKASPDDQKNLRDLIDEKYDNYQDSKASAKDKARIKKLYNSLENGQD